MIPAYWQVTHTLTNTGGWPLTNVLCDIKLQDPNDYIEYDPNYPTAVQQVLDTLHTKQSHDFTWYFRLKKRNTSGIAQYAVTLSSFGSDQTMYNNSECPAILCIDPVSPGPEITELEDADSLMYDNGLPMVKRFPKHGTSEAVGEYILYRNHPNPFNPVTTIEYNIPSAGHVRLEVVDMLGRCVDVLVDDEMKPGKYSVVFKGWRHAPGIYVYRLLCGEQAVSKSMILTR